MQLKRLSVDAEVSTLSGGQRQAVAIARALLNVPKLLILDEPTAALGVIESQKVIDLIKNLRTNGVTILIISHDIQEITAIADLVIELKQGKLASL